MKNEQTTTLRCVINSKLYAIELPFHHCAGQFERWRREIVLAGPLDLAIVRAVQRLEQQDGVEVVWRGPRGRYCTSAMEVSVRKRAAKKRPRDERKAG